MTSERTIAVQNLCGNQITPHNKIPIDIGQTGHHHKEHMFLEEELRKGDRKRWVRVHGAHATVYLARSTSKRRFATRSADAGLAKIRLRRHQYSYYIFSAWKNAVKKL